MAVDKIRIKVDSSGNFTHDPSTKHMETPTQHHTGPSQVQWVGVDIEKFVVTFPISPFQKASFKDGQVAVVRKNTAPGVYNYSVAVDAVGDIWIDNCPEIDVDC